jgi:hypothetical protein
MDTPDYSSLVARQREYFLSGSTRTAVRPIPPSATLLRPSWWTSRRPRPSCRTNWGFEAFTNARGVMYHGARIDPGVRYPPYSTHTTERKIEGRLMP